MVALRCKIVFFPGTQAISDMLRTTICPLLGRDNGARKGGNGFGGFARVKEPTNTSTVCYPMQTRILDAKTGALGPDEIALNCFVCAPGSSTSSRPGRHGHISIQWMQLPEPTRCLTRCSVNCNVFQIICILWRFPRPARCLASLLSYLRLRAMRSCEARPKLSAETMPLPSSID